MPSNISNSQGEFAIIAMAMLRILNHQKIEQKWRREWERGQLYHADDFSRKPKFYGLVEFPYPSGDGLHVGHIRSYTAMDVIARKRRMQGYNVLYPIGWDAFGLPTENYAVKTGLHPKVVTKINTDNFRRQLKSLGFSFDWSREINTTDPNYYKWTQWIFLKFFEKGLAYKKKMPINWCLSCKIGLANEEVVGGRCERCAGQVIERQKEQWLLAITKYAERLLKDLDKVDFLTKIKIQQQNWIGKSAGAEIEFKIQNSKLKISVFTTRPDTLFGATYMVLAPECSLIEDLKLTIKNWPKVRSYIQKSEKKSELERVETKGEKTGIEFKGIKAINPANKKEIPIFTADYVLASYGTGAIMGVPAHDRRDFGFAKKFSLPILQVIKPEIKTECWEGEGKLINSGKFTGMDSEKAKWEITKFVGGKKQVQYHLRDWIFSRQRYWGEPIPLVFCSGCKTQAESLKLKVKNLKFSRGELLNPGWSAVPEKDLPVKLPEIKRYKPTKTEESPLSKIKSFVETKCPKCGGKATRETDVMPNWAGSSWYFLAYIMKGVSSNYQLPITNYQKAFKYWMPVDWYNGGMEHTTLHLLYSRFWNKFLYDLKLSPTSEPYQKRTSHGMILGEGGEKMSKSKGNVVNPDGIVKEFGADALRLYELFMGPFDQATVWDRRGILGTSRFLGRVWEISQSKKIKTGAKNHELKKLLHQTIKKVSEDVESMSFNTAVSHLMIFANKCAVSQPIPKDIFEFFLIILAPFAPFMAEEIWQKLGHKKSIHQEEWPKYNKDLIQDERFDLIIQINGRVRDKITVPRNISQKEAENIALQSDKAKKFISGSIKKIIFVPNRLINIAL